MSMYMFQNTDEVSGSQISLEDFAILKVIGRGAYAKVLMVELKTTQQIYAMKVIKKSSLQDEVLCMKHGTVYR